MRDHEAKHPEGLQGATLHHLNAEHGMDINMIRQDEVNDLHTAIHLFYDRGKATSGLPPVEPGSGLLDEQERESLTFWGDNLNAQLRDYQGGSRLAMSFPEGQRLTSIEEGVFEIGVKDVARLRDLIRFGEERGVLY